MSGAAKPKAAIEKVRRALEILVTPGSAVELRIPHAPHQGTASGYFSNLDRMAQCAAAMSGKAEGVYISANPVNPDLLARASNRLASFARHTTSDHDVVRLCRFLIDFDPVRPAGISSTATEHEAALERARQCREWLRTQGWPDPIYADSGNGAHLLYLLDLPNDKTSSELLKSCLEALDFRFTDSTVQVDLNTYNAGRLCKVYGTLAAKGDNVPERPHRLTRIVEAPLTQEPVPNEFFERLAQTSRQAAGRQTARSGDTREDLDLQRWIFEHNLEVDGPTRWKDGRKWIFNVCLFNPDHRDRSAYIVQFASGAIGAGCLHKSCDGRDWHALRDLVEPGWRNRRDADGSRLDGTEEQTARIQLVPADKFLARRSEDDCTWLVEKLIPAQSQGLWQGRPKTGKSHSTLQLGFDAAAGLPVFGHFGTHRPVRVLYGEFEEPEAVTKQRFAAMLRAHEGNGPQSNDLLFLNRNDLHRMRLLPRELLFRCLKDFTSVVKDSGAELVILVALRSLLGGGGTNHTEVERAARLVAR